MKHYKMKLLQALGLVCCFATINVFAARVGGSAIDLGVQGGANIGSSNGIGTTSNTQFLAGVFTEPVIGRNLHLQPELNYMGQGPGLAYLSVPIMLKYKIIGEQSKFRPFVGAGPEIDFRLSGTNTNPVSFGLAFMGGVHYAINPSFSLYAAGRYLLGITNTLDIPGADVKLRNFNLLAGVLIAI